VRERERERERKRERERERERERGFGVKRAAAPLCLRRLGHSLSAVQPDVNDIGNRRKNLRGKIEKVLDSFD
jgi:hypothetical protein